MKFCLVINFKLLIFFFLDDYTRFVRHGILVTVFWESEMSKMDNLSFEVLVVTNFKVVSNKV